MRIVPPARPQWNKAKALQVLQTAGVGEEIALLGVRGYFRDSMGARGRNDRGIYDDAVMLVTPFVFATWNANTDPSIRRPKIASLLPGVWRYKKGKHNWRSPKGYPALIQASPVTVMRDGPTVNDPPYPDTGFFGINIHKGSLRSTSSLGCQTIYPTQWEGFRAMVYGEMERMGARTIAYALVETQG